MTKNQMTKTESIKLFLQEFAQSDLAALYSHDMECQITVLKLNGEKVNREYMGRRWQEFTDPITNESWKPIRIPYGANSEPHFDDNEMKFSLSKFADGIGMTGWDWVNKRSKWVAFDFDAVVGHSERHSKKLSLEELEIIKNKLMEIPWVAIRRSSGGLGLHLYVFLNAEITITNHSEHAAVARAILSRLSIEINHDLQNDVDVCGGNMWVWHRKATKENKGFELLKPHTCFGEVPADWRDHLDVITYKKSKTLPKNLDASFLELSGQLSQQQLDEDHLALIKWLTDNSKYWFWSQDHHMLVTHTHSLAKAHESLKLRGHFKTISEGTEVGDHNCFCFPMPNGIWVVRRYGKGTTESKAWSIDKKGFTYCWFNKTTDIVTILKLMEALDHPKGGFVLNDSSGNKQSEFAKVVGIEMPEIFKGRPLLITEHKKSANKICLQVEYNKEIVRDGLNKKIIEDPDQIDGWILEVKKWKRVVTGNFQFAPEELNNYDNLIRHIIGVDGKDAGWLLKASGHWNHEPLMHIRSVLDQMGAEPNVVIGESVLEPWRIVNKPFENEFPGGRQWNFNSAQLRVLPQEPPRPNSTPTWDKIYNHIGKGLNEFLENNAWAKENGITTGGEYLRCWMASVIQYPRRPTPYLFFWSREQKTGKSTFHETMPRLISNGVMNASVALTSSSGFNSEIEKAVVCYLDEFNLGTNKIAYDRMKDWVTTNQILIHPKRGTPYLIDNTTHWAQSANEPSYCPVFPGDSRVMVIKVEPFTGSIIPRDMLFEQLDQEAPYFLYQLLKLELPPSHDRLNVPVIDTQTKSDIMTLNTNELVQFIEEHGEICPGTCILYAQFFDTFQNWLEPTNRSYWSRRQIGKLLPEPLFSGRIDAVNHFFIANFKFKDDKFNGKHLYKMHDSLTLIRVGTSIKVPAPKMDTSKMDSPKLAFQN